MSESSAQSASIEESPEEFLASLEVLGGRRLALLVSGSLSAAYLPYWLNFVSGLPHPPDVRVLLTRTAATMVSPVAVSALMTRNVEMDDWNQHDSGHPLHVDLAEWSDVFVVHPCTFSYFGRLAGGLADTPYQLAFQTSQIPAVVCPALPPGSLDSPVYRRHFSAIHDRGEVTVLSPTLGISAATGQREGLPPAPFTVALAAAADALAGHEQAAGV